MEIVNIGTAFFSNDILTLESKFEMDYENTFYKINRNGIDCYIVQNFTGFFEIPYRFLIDNALNDSNDVISFYNQNNDLFFEKILSDNNSKFLLFSLGSENNVYSHPRTKKSLTKYNELITDIELKGNRKGKMWFLSVFRECFWRYTTQPDVYLTKGGFKISDFENVFGHNIKTRNSNFKKLKELKLIDYDYKKNTIQNLTFNIEKFPIQLKNIPTIFLDAFKSFEDYNRFKPINNQLKNIVNLDFKNEYSNQNEIEIDYIKKQIDNQSIGLKSEEYAKQFEIERLKSLGIDNAESLVNVVSDNSSLGYDIQSIDENNNKRHIEVKTVKKYSEYYTFHISANQLEKTENLENYFIYIVIYNKNEPTVKVLSAVNIKSSEYFKIVPTDYRVYIKL